jgi:hypothetical protein
MDSSEGIVLFDQHWRRMRTVARLSLITGLIVDVLASRGRDGAKRRLFVRSAGADCRENIPEMILTVAGFLRAILFRFVVP